MSTTPTERRSPDGDRGAEQTPATSNRSATRMLVATTGRELPGRAAGADPGTHSLFDTKEVHP